MVNPIDLNPTQPAQPGATPKPPRAQEAAATSFAEVLREQQQTQAGKGLRLSAHAQQRLESRGITLTPREMAQAEQALDKLAAKGAKEALLVTERSALVVSVANRTVITAMPREEAGENVFTQIDSAAILPHEEPAAQPQVKDRAGLL